jgi:cytochrome b
MQTEPTSDERPTERILVWDIPVRLFHWLLAAAFIGAFVIANLVDDESSLFPLHMLLGGIVAFMVLLRVIWGFVGSRYARFGSFAFGPRALGGYVRGAFAGKAERRYAGHNPGSAWAAYGMLAIALGLAFTGAFMSSGGELFEEIHEILAWAMIALVGAHVAGMIWHTIRHQENIARSMVDGRKQGDPAAAIGSSHALVGVAFLALTGLWAGALYAGYDAPSSQLTLPLIGKTIKLGEAEEHGERERGKHEKHDDHDDHDDD